MVKEDPPLVLATKSDNLSCCPKCRQGILDFSTMGMSINPRDAGIGENAAPSGFFFRQVTNNVDIGAKLPAFLSTSIWSLPSKFQKTHVFLFENRVLVASCFAILGTNGSCSKAPGAYSLEVKLNRKNTKGVKLNTLQNVFLRLFPSFDLTPKFQIPIPQKEMPPKSRTVILSKKTAYIF